MVGSRAAAAALLVTAASSCAGVEPFGEDGLGGLFAFERQAPSTDLQVGVPFGDVAYIEMTPERAIVALGPTNLAFTAPDGMRIDPDALAVLVGAPTITMDAVDDGPTIRIVLFSPEIARALNGGRAVLTAEAYAEELRQGAPRGGVGLNFSLLEPGFVDTAASGTIAAIRSDIGGETVLKLIGYAVRRGVVVTASGALPDGADATDALARMRGVLDGIADGG